MWFGFGVVCLIFYMACCTWFFAGSIVQLHLLWKSRKKEQKKDSSLLPLHLPAVTIQVPVYNERYVISRLLHALGQIDYPLALLEIQVLDDSNDDTSEIIRKDAAILRAKGIDITIIRRRTRSGFKAGALQEGLPLCKGELIAIFDADFIPARDFIRRLIGYFNDPQVGGVQGRWQHTNLDQNTLTKVQAFLLDTHFTLEQAGRSAAGYFMNFNGTAGMWRKKCIIDCGGWNGDILSEDLELSYRAQLSGWKFKYDDHVAVPAELPADMDAFKTQQFRWAKGMAQTAMKHLQQVWKAPVRLSKKLHAVFHLLGSVSFLAVMGNIILALPLLAGRHFIDGYHQLTTFVLLTGITLPMICVYYYFGTASTFSRRVFWTYLPAFLVMYMALSVQNSIAVLQGLSGYASPFIRTPKSSVKRNTYVQSKWTAINNMELLTAVYLCIGIVLSVAWRDAFFLLFFIMALTGLVILLAPAIAKTGSRFIFKEKLHGTKGFSEDQQPRRHIIHRNTCVR